MIQLKKIEILKIFQVLNKKIKFVYKGWEEPNTGQEIVYYSLLVNKIDKTQELFSADTIPCVLNEKVEVEHPNKNFAFIPCSDSILLNTKDFSKIKLKVYFRENGSTFCDTLVGSFFYSEKHLLINKRSLIVTDLNTLKTKKIKFQEEVNIEWAFFINATQIQIIEAFSNICFLYDLERQEVINKENVIDELLYPTIFRWIYRGQEYNSDEIQMELLQKKEGEFISNYFKII